MFTSEQCGCVYMNISKRVQWSWECLRAWSRDHSSLQYAFSQRKELFIVHFLHKADRRHIAKTNRNKRKCTSFLYYFNSLRWIGTSDSTELFLILNKIGNVYFSLKYTLFFFKFLCVFYRSTSLVSIFIYWKYKHKVVAKLITSQKWHCTRVETDTILQFIR